MPLNELITTRHMSSWTVTVPFKYKTVILISILFIGSLAWFIGVQVIQPRFSSPYVVNIDSTSSINSTTHSDESCKPVREAQNVTMWKSTDLERLSPKMTGPRLKPPKQRSLLTIPIGGKSINVINETVWKFLDNGAGRVMLFAYDKYDWSSQSWYWDDRVILVRHLRQMKWWFIKRFVTPLTVEAYDYIWFADDDASFDWNPHTFMDILDRFQIELAQPSHKTQPPCSPSSWRVTHQVANNTGRWTNFIECGPLAIVSKNLWSRCLWNFIQDDLTSGYGLDEMWHHACNAPKTAVIDALPMCHRSLRTARSSSTQLYDPHSEWSEYGRRFPNVKKSPNNQKANNLGVF
jgi:hypothetical protein